MAFAASCAAFFSKARNEGKVPVAKALVSDLSKPTGAAPGKACPTLLLLCARRKQVAVCETPMPFQAQCRCVRYMYRGMLFVQKQCTVVCR